ncbi:MAG: SH3 domain-containing protein [Cyanobacteria bacterium Co-bin13]|nr:SH3 domain-containing protein [Cyanobacteria bacterium Co-bin13]
MKKSLKPYFLAAAIATLGTLAGASCALQATPQPSTSAPAIVSQPPTANSSAPAANPAAPAAGPSAPAANPSAPEVATPSEGPAAQAPASREVLSCITTMAIVDDPDAPLNVRSSPVVAEGNVVDQFENGVFLTVTGEQSGWLQISEPVVGWVAKNRVDSTCNQKVERIRFAAGSDRIGVADYFVGTGSHQYVLTARAGQTITLQGQKGPLPVIAGPNGQPLASAAGWENKTSWSGQLPTTGDYTLTLDSNYKGYDYAFSVQVQ